MHKMKEQITYAFYLIGLGFILVAYAHSNFATVTTIDLILKSIERIEVKINAIDEKIYDLNRERK